MITTKKGQEGKVSVTISNSSQFANPFVMPKFQDQYVNRPGEIKTWGDKATSEFGTYEPADFFNTGTNIQNNISLTARIRHIFLWVRRMHKGLFLITHMIGIILRFVIPPHS